MKKFLTWDSSGRFLEFEFDEDHGTKTGLPFSGKLIDNLSVIDVNVKKNDDQILIIESAKLRKLSHHTIKMLTNAKLVITNSS